MKTLQHFLFVVLAAAVIACGGAGLPYGPGATTAGNNGGGNGGNNNGGNNNGGGGGSFTQLGQAIRPIRIDDNGRTVATDSTSVPFFVMNGVRSSFPAPPDGRAPVFIDMNFKGTVLVTTDPPSGQARHNYLLMNGTYTELAADASNPYPIYVTENDQVLATKGIIWTNPTTKTTYNPPANFTPLSMNSSGTILGYVGSLGSSFGQGDTYYKIQNGVVTNTNVQIGYDYLFPTVGALINDAGTIVLKSGQQSRILPANGGSMQIANFQPRGRLTSNGVFAGQDGYIQVLTSGPSTEGRSMAFVYSTELGSGGPLRKQFTVPAVTSFFGANCVNNNGLLMGSYRPAGSGTPTYAFSTVITPAFFAGSDITVSLGNDLSIPAKGKIQFNAVVQNTPNQQVTYSIDESNAGTISSTGLYQAPRTAGTFHIRATSVADNNVFDLVEVTVISLGAEGEQFGPPQALDGPANMVVASVSPDGTITGNSGGANSEALYWNGFQGSAFPLKRTGYVAAKATGSYNGKIVGTVTQQNGNGDRFDFVVCWPSALDEPVKLLAPSGYMGVASTPSINANGEIVSNALYWTKYDVHGAPIDGIDGGVGHESIITNQSMIVVKGQPGFRVPSPSGTAIQMTSTTFGFILGVDQMSSTIVGVDGAFVPPPAVKFTSAGGFAKTNLTTPTFVQSVSPVAASELYAYIAGNAMYADGTKGVAIFRSNGDYHDLRALSNTTGNFEFLSVVGIGDDGNILVKAKKDGGAEKYYFCLHP